MTELLIVHSSSAAAASVVLPYHDMGDLPHSPPTDGRIRDIHKVSGLQARRNTSHPGQTGQS